MKFYRFLNSKDVRMHLEAMEYQFSPLEAAWVVYRSKNAALQDKHKAWRSIIETMPDTEIDLEDWEPRRDSLHAFLQEYMAMESRLLFAFYDLGNLALYNYYEPDFDSVDVMVDHRGVYYDLKSCLDDALKAGDAPFVDLYRMDLTSGKRIRVTFDRQRSPVRVIPEYILWLPEEELLRGSFFRIGGFRRFPFRIPLPFQKYDLICEPVPDPELYDPGYTLYEGPGYTLYADELDKEKVDLDGLTELSGEVILMKILRDYMKGSLSLRELIDRFSHEIVSQLTDACQLFGPIRKRYIPSASETVRVQDDDFPF